MVNVVRDGMRVDVKAFVATYAHVIRKNEDRVRSIVDGSAEDWLRTKAV